VLPVIVLGAAFLVLLAGLAAFYRYSHTDAWRHGEVRRATFELLLVIGPFFGVRVKPPEPEPPAVLTPKGDDEDPNAARFRIGPAPPGGGGDETAAKPPDR
jgi:hypothetical protein